MQALDAHDYVAAERACGGANALVKAPTAATCWGRALEGLGRLVEARDVFMQITHLPTKPDDPAVFVSAREVAATEADGLVTRIPTVTIVISGPPETGPVQVTVDGVGVKSETARLPRKVNPGRHTIAVSAPGYAPATSDVSVVEREERRVEVALRPSSGDSPLPSTEPSTPQRDAGQERGGRTVPVLAIVAGGVGLGGLVVGLAAGVVGSSKHSVLPGECDTTSGTCPPSAQSDLDAFHTWRTLSTVGYVVGAVGLVAGGVVFFTAPTARSSAGGTTGVYVGPASCGVTGAF
jgi:hypothetical protein